MNSLSNMPIRALRRLRLLGGRVKRSLITTWPSSLAGDDDVSSSAELDLVQTQRAKAAFDEAYYLQKNPDVAAAGADAWKHYLTHGWMEGRDPTPEFSTSYYLATYTDVSASKTNPFIHYVNWGMAEGRNTEPLLNRTRRQMLLFKPKVSVIIPNYNHARFLPERIESILGQTYQNIDLLLLDDKSSDNSVEVIREYCERYPDQIRAILNQENSGNVFAQWRKGLENTDGAFVWICESDDFCDPHFLEQAVGHFLDQSVNIVFGRIQFANAEGHYQAGLDDYREGAEPGIWNKPTIRPAREWFAHAFGVNNVIANVGGCLWRRPALSEHIWNDARTYTILGDWFLYCHVAGGGQIAYEPRALTYFRQHGANTSVSFTKPAYYREHERLMKTLRSEWDIPDATVESFYEKVLFQYEHFHAREIIGPLDQYIDKSRILSVSRQRHHILIAFLGFHPGGGELFPINLANALAAAGHKISMLAYDLAQVNADMQSQVNPAITVYDARRVAEAGVDHFLKSAGITVINSHMALLDLYFFDEHRIKSHIPYLTTLHGSYECFDLDDGSLMRVIKGVTHWVYTADKNLLPFSAVPLDHKIFSKLGNAMPFDPRPFPKTRAELGIADDAVVFTLVARGIQRKGWRAAIEAFIRLRIQTPERKLHLLLCGNGDQTSRHMEVHGDDPDISFLGYQSCIHGLYALSDCALVPTRFAGESFPLCIIQAMQVGTPIIATKVGEIEAMMTGHGTTPGIMIEYERDTELFIEGLKEAMAAMLDGGKRREFSSSARLYGQRYDIASLAQEYFQIFERLSYEVPLQFADQPLTASSS